MSFPITAMVLETIHPGLRRMILAETEGGHFLLCLGKDAGAVPPPAPGDVRTALLGMVPGAFEVSTAPAPHVDGESLNHSPLVQAAVAEPLGAPQAAVEEKPAPKATSAQLPLFSRARRPRTARPEKVGTKATRDAVRGLKRDLRDSGLSDTELGAKWGFHRTHVSRIRRGVTYKRIRAAKPAAAGAPS